ncbi:MAG: hypothetical protein HIU82_05010 [Proteobacteria bacterium]|nr:hypothetical protein [Pseudomonadota bacterium]
MSVTLDRFKRVLSGGTVVSDKLVTVRNDKVGAALAELKNELDRLSDAGMANTTLEARRQTLIQARIAALRQTDNQAKCDALERIKDAARAAVIEARKQADQLLGNPELKDKADAALAACNDTAAEIALVSDPLLRAPLERALADLQNLRLTHSTADNSGAVQKAIVELPKVTTAAILLAVRAGTAARLATDRAKRLGEIDTQLADLRTLALQVVDDPMVRATNKLLAPLGQRRDLLATAGPDKVAGALDGADALADDIATASDRVTAYVNYGKRKVERTMILGAAQGYLAAAKKPGQEWLKKDTEAMQKGLAAVQKMSVADPAGALTALNDVKKQYDNLKASYVDRVLKGPLLGKIDQLIKDNPDGPEAQMVDALSAPEFERRALEVAHTQFAFGMDPTLLSPGEAVAVYTYTSNDYSEMNGLLLGLPSTASGEQMRKTKIKNDQATAALTKLPNYPAGITKRGEQPWPGADAQYTQDKVFTVKAFWSTGVGFNFPGAYQISIKGKTGKNVMTMSNFPKESEVLFAPGTQFKVLSRDDTGAPNKILVVVEEV